LRTPRGLRAYLDPSKAIVCIFFQNAWIWGVCGF